MFQGDAVYLSPGSQLPVNSSDLALARRLARSVRSIDLRNYLEDLARRRTWQVRTSMAVHLLHVDGDTCHLCRGALGIVPAGIEPAAGSWDARRPTLDHLIPACDPSSTFDEENLRLAHGECNARRGTRCLAPDLAAPFSWQRAQLSVRPLRYTWSARRAVARALRPRKLIVALPSGRVPMTTLMRGGLGDRILDALAYAYVEDQSLALPPVRATKALVQASSRVMAEPDYLRFATTLDEALAADRPIVMRTVGLALTAEANIAWRQEYTTHGLAM